MLYGIKQFLFEYFLTAVSGKEQNEGAGSGRGTALIWIFYLRIFNPKSKTFQSIGTDSVGSWQKNWRNEKKKNKNKLAN